MKRVTVIIAQLIAMVVGLVVIVAVADYLLVGRTAKLAVDVAALGLFLGVSGYNQRRRTQRLKQMWQAADQLGYGPEELKQRAPQYGTLDWAAARPEVAKFYPSDKVVSALLTQFEAELAQAQNN